MSGIRRIIAIGMTVLSGIAIYCFYSLKYPYHLHFQEQYQLFEFTSYRYKSVIERFHIDRAAPAVAFRGIEKRGSRSRFTVESLSVRGGAVTDQRVVREIRRYRARIEYGKPVFDINGVSMPRVWIN